jgi:hypothetical protein
MKIIYGLLIMLIVTLAGCLKPYHFDEDWWKEKIEARDTDWGPEIKDHNP